jgi:hypothetical protein
LLHAAPIELSGSRECWHIVDHYFPDTRLRLRRMSSLWKGNHIQVYSEIQVYNSGGINDHSSPICTRRKNNTVSWKS